MQKGLVQVADTLVVRQELDRILASPVFATSPRMSKFLRFVVEETIEGRSDRIMGRNWTITSTGIYYFDSGGAAGAPRAVKFHRFKTGKVNVVGAVESTVSTDFSGIAVSSDGRWFLYSHVASTASDLMLLDGLR